MDVLLSGWVVNSGIGYLLIYGFQFVLWYPQVKQQCGQQLSNPLAADARACALENPIMPKGDHFANCPRRFFCSNAYKTDAGPAIRIASCRNAAGSSLATISVCHNFWVQIYAGKETLGSQRLVRFACLKVGRIGFLRHNRALSPFALARRKGTGQ